MNCSGVSKLFGSYWDDEITLAERDWLESHFASCAACREAYEDFARAIELVGSLPRLEVKPGLAERALARARRATAAPDRLPLGAPRWIPVTATAALLAIAATMTLQWMGVAPNGRTRPRSAPVAGLASVPSPTPVTSVPLGRQDVAPGGDRDDATAAGAQLASAVPDSLFDHSADVEFILDPVTLRKGRAHTVLRVNPNVQGEKAVITF
jgi:predicted anti-sigma-YlaC factor YlaD